MEAQGTREAGAQYVTLADIFNTGDTTADDMAEMQSRVSERQHADEFMELLDEMNSDPEVSEEDIHDVTDGFIASKRYRLSGHDLLDLEMDMEWRASAVGFFETAALGFTWQESKALADKMVKDSPAEAF